MQAHVTFARKQEGDSDSCSDSVGINIRYKEMQVHHAQNLERVAVRWPDLDIALESTCFLRKK